MRVRTWKVIKYGAVPEHAPTVPYNCPGCNYEAELPVLGRALAQMGGGGIVFDNDGPYAIPAVVQCRKCGRILTTEDE